MRYLIDKTSPLSNKDAGPRRALILVLAVVVGISVLGLTVTLANASSARRVAENASLLHWTNSAQGSAALARSAIGQAVLFSFSHSQGVVDAQAETEAMEEAEKSLAAFLASADVIPPALLENVPEVREQLDAFDTAAADVLSLLSLEENAAADYARTGPYEESYTELITTLQASQDLVTERISNNEDRAALLAQLTRLLVTLLIPAAALIVYWRIARRQLRERRVEMNAKITAQRELIAGVSHELRTPLTVIYGASEVLLGEDDNDGAVTTELVTMINNETADLSRMVEDLLAAARIDMDELTFVRRAFSPIDEIEAVAEPFRRVGRVIDVECIQGTITADDALFRQILRNLISNAVKHGGPRCLVRGTWDDDPARFTVMDNGPGVSEALEVRLFEPFANSGDQALLSGSVGLGLAVSLAIARGMGGTLSYDRENEWSSFTLTLPRSPTAPDRHGDPTATDDRSEVPQEPDVRSNSGPGVASVPS